MNSLPPSFLTQLPILGPQIRSTRKLGLFFNLSYLETGRGDISRIYRQIRWLSAKPNLLIALLSSRSVAELQVQFGDAPFLLIAENGYVIEGPEFSWSYPELATIRAHLGEVLEGLQEQAPELFQNGNYSYSPTELWIRILTPDANSAHRVEHFMRGLKSDQLGVSRQNGMIQIEPVAKWNRCQVIAKVLQYSLPSGTPFPALLYFGGDDEDEEVFKLLAPYGWTVIVRSRPPLKSDASYLLRDLGELSKFLYWLHAS